MKNYLTEFKCVQQYLLFILFLSSTTVPSYAQKPTVGDVLYAVDLQDNSKVYEMKVTEEKKRADNYADESFKVERKLLEEQKAPEKKKKKGGFGKLLKEAGAGGAKQEKSTEAPKSLGEEIFEYEMTNDNTDNTTEDLTMMEGQFKMTIEYSTHKPFRHGFFYEIGDGFYKEVFFVNEKNDLYMEDPSTLHTIFVIGKDKAATVAKAGTMNFEEEKQKFYTPDPKSGRLPNPAIDAQSYTFDLDINSVTGEFELPYGVKCLYLPTKSIEGRNLMYNRDILRIDLFKGDQLIGTKQTSKGHTKGRWLEKVVNNVEISYKSFGKLKAGKYQLRYYLIENEPFFLADFEVYTIPNDDINAENTEFYLMRGCTDGYLRIMPGETIEDEIRYTIPLMPLFNILPKKLTEIKDFEVKLMKNGKQYGKMDHSNNDRKTMTFDLMWNGKPSLDQEYDVKFLTMNSPGRGSAQNGIEYLSRQKMGDGEYKIEYHANGKLYATTSFKIKDQEFVLEGDSNRETADPKRYLVNPEGWLYIPLTYHY